MPAARRARAVPQDPDQEETAEPQEETDPGSEPDSSEGSSASDLLADPGPEYDQGQAEKDAKARDQDRLLSVAPGQDGGTGIEVQWHPEVIKGMLRAQGAVTHELIGKAEKDWAWTDTELVGAARPLANILNRYDATRLAAATGDEIALAMALAGYTMRSVKERRAALALLEPDEEPGSGIPTPPIPQEGPIQ
jgi:hypothetical protein